MLGAMSKYLFGERRNLVGECRYYGVVRNFKTHIFLFNMHICKYVL
jgi:hypothetical protein